jgi:3-phosphoshikimate 1-carboxyvinyltransferase
MAETIEIHPVDRPIQGIVEPPGSKSLTNRALIVASLANGNSRLSGLLDSLDTRVMIDGLRKMGITINHDAGQGIADVQGCGGKPSSQSAKLWIENSGTSLRFLTAFCTLADGEFRLDGNQRMQQRPVGDLADALNALGSNVFCKGVTRCPPVTVQSQNLPGGKTEIAGTISSQYLSAILMAAPCAQSEVELNVSGELVSKPYIEMTLGAMRAFGVTVETTSANRFLVKPAQYQAVDYLVEPDASAASYFFAAAAVTGGEVTVMGLSKNSLQGDVEFVNVLERMGCRVHWQSDRITLQGGPLRGVNVDMNAISDTAQTLAAVAIFAKGPTRITNIAHVRHKETDRIDAVATELRRMKIRIEETHDGITIQPGHPLPATINTYDDHRMAMSFAIVGLKASGIRIADPQCTSKTYPNFFEDLTKLCETAR